jgi:hypothetical protein
LLADALSTAKAAGAAGLVIVRADAAYYCYEVPARRAARVPDSRSPPE